MKTGNNIHPESTSSKYQPRYAAKREAALEREMYRAQARTLLIKGGIGFAIGFLLLFTTDNEWQIALLMGFVFAGIPYGWELLGKFTGHWLAWGSGGFVFLVYALQFLGACTIGALAYPTALLNVLIKAQMPGSILQKVFQAIRMVWFGFWALMVGVMIYAGCL